MALSRLEAPTWGAAFGSLHDWRTQGGHKDDDGDRAGEAVPASKDSFVQWGVMRILRVI